TIDLTPYADAPGGVPEGKIYAKIKKNHAKLKALEKKVKDLQHKVTLKSLKPEKKKELSDKLDALLIDLIWLVKDCQFQKKVRERFINRLKEQGENLEEQEHLMHK